MASVKTNSVQVMRELQKHALNSSDFPPHITCHDSVLSYGYAVLCMCVPIGLRAPGAGHCVILSRCPQHSIAYVVAGPLMPAEYLNDFPFQILLTPFK